MSERSFEDMNAGAPDPDAPEPNPDLGPAISRFLEEDEECPTCGSDNPRYFRAVWETSGLPTYCSDLFHAAHIMARAFVDDVLDQKLISVESIQSLRELAEDQMLRAPEWRTTLKMDPQDVLALLDRIRSLEGRLEQVVG